MLDITIKNYRCFPQSRPARLAIGPGVTAFLGVNNSGKSSLLRLFFEMRNLFGYLSHVNGNLLEALRGNSQGLNPQGLLDQREIFPRGNTADAEISFRFNSDVRGERRPVILTVVLQRETLGWTAQLNTGVSFERTKVDFPSPPKPVLNANGSPLVDLSPLFEAIQPLTRTCYLPSFRNAINTGTRSDYYDISVGQAFVQTFRTWKTGNSIVQNEAVRHQPFSGRYHITALYK